MVDTGSSHNFMSPTKAERLELMVTNAKIWLKTVNAETKPLNGVMQGVKLKLDKWTDKVNFSVAPINDFSIILGMDFIQHFNIIPFYRLNMVMILEGEPCIIHTIAPPKTSSSSNLVQCS